MPVSHDNARKWKRAPKARHVHHVFVGSKHALSNRYLYKRIVERTGYARQIVRDVTRVFILELIETLARGEEINIYEFGRFWFKFRKGCTIRGKTHPDFVYLSFKVSKCLKNRVKLLPTEVGRRAKTYSGFTRHLLNKNIALERARWLADKKKREAEGKASISIGDA